MRPPRYQFPDEVRTATRYLAARMVQTGDIAHTPAELEGWIARDPSVDHAMRDGGYGIEFTADDLFPLLQVMVTKAGGPAPAPEPAAKASGGRGRLVSAIIAAVVVIIVVLLVTQFVSQLPL